MALLDYLRERRETIEDQMKALKAELAEIRVAEAALLGEPAVKRPTVVGGGVVLRAGTIKDWIMKAMTAFPDGMETDAVIEAIRKMGGPIVERSSITPQLSRLKAAGLIAHDGKHWRLPTAEEKTFSLQLDQVIGTIFGLKNETPGVSPPDVSEGEETPRGPFA